MGLGLNLLDLGQILTADFDLYSLSVELRTDLSSLLVSLFKFYTSWWQLFILVGLSVARLTELKF